MQSLHALEVANNESILFLYEHFNISPWYQNPLSSLKPTIVRFVNSLGAALNDKQIKHLSRYIIILPDRDILDDLVGSSLGYKKVIKIQIKWLITQFKHLIETRRENLLKLKAGAVSKESTRFIWVKMIARPISTNEKLVRILKLRRKFNEALEDLLLHEEHMHIMSINTLSEENYFDLWGHLTSAGTNEMLGGHQSSDETI